MDHFTPGMSETVGGASESRGFEDVGSPTTGVADTVEASIPCLRCGYELRGLPLAGRCPECGWEIERSLRGNLYRYAPTEFVRRMHVGALVAEIAVLSLLPVQIISGIIGVSVQRYGDVMTGKFVSAAFGSVCYLALLVGWWMLSSPDPSGDPAKDPKSRRILRITLGIGAAGALAQPFLALVGGSFSGLLPGPGAGGMASATLPLVLGGVAYGVIVIAYLVQWFAAMVYARRMAARVPDQILDKRAKILIWGPVWVIAGMCALALLSALFIGILSSSSQGAGASAIGFVIFPICGGVLAMGAAWLVFYIIYAMLLDRLRTQLSATLRAQTPSQIDLLMPVAAPIMQPPPLPPIDQPR